LDRPPPQGEGPVDSARALGGSVLALLEARVELIGIEFREEAEFRKRLILLAAVAALFVGLGLLLLAFLIVVLFWDSYRLPAIAGVTLVYCGIGAWAILRFRQLVRDSPSPFSATLAEFRKDIEMLRGRHA
jgi:uncharacterized membrane protein YqjE